MRIGRDAALLCAFAFLIFLFLRVFLGPLCVGATDDVDRVGQYTVIEGIHFFTEFLRKKVRMVDREMIGYCRTATQHIYEGFKFSISYTVQTGDELDRKLQKLICFLLSSLRKARHHHESVFLESLWTIGTEGRARMGRWLEVDMGSVHLGLLSD